MRCVLIFLALAAATFAGPVQCPVQTPESVAVDSACVGLGASIFGYSGSTWIAKAEDIWTLGDRDYNDAVVTIDFGESARITVVQNGGAAYDDLIGVNDNMPLHNHAYGSYADFAYTTDAEFLLQLRNPYGAVFVTGSAESNADHAIHWWVECQSGCEPDPPPDVPEPATFLLAGLGIAGTLVARIRAARLAKRA